MNPSPLNVCTRLQRSNVPDAISAKINRLQHVSLGNHYAFGNVNQNDVARKWVINSSDSCRVRGADLREWLALLVVTIATAPRPPSRPYSYVNPFSRRAAPGMEA